MRLLLWQSKATQRYTKPEERMPRRIVDISVALKAGIVSDPPYMLPQITYLDHNAGALNFMAVFGVTRDQLPDGAGPAVEQVAISTHNGTHLDAPYHFHPTMDNGKPAMTIDEVPLEWCFNDAIKLDFLDKADGYVCTADDMKRALDRIGYQLKPLDIVLVNTTAGKAYGQPDFIDRGCGFGRGDAVSAEPGRARDRHEWLELGRAVQLHGQALQGNR
jgi:hypothetical protein